MLTPLSPASANSRASSPGWSGTATKTDAVGRTGPPCLPGIARVPATPLREQGLQARPGRRRRAAAISASSRSRTSRQQLAHGVGVGRRRSGRRAPGRPPATRVTSRTPCPDSARCSRRRVGEARRRPARPAGAAGGRCGRRPGRAPPGSAAPARRRTARPAPRPAPPPRRPTPSCGVTAHGPAVEQGGAARPAGPNARCRPSGGRRRSAPRRRARRPPASGAGLHAADVGDDRVAAASRAAGDRLGRGGRAARRPRPAAAGRRRRRPAGAEPGGGAQVVLGGVGAAAPRCRPGGRPARSRCRAGRRRRSATGPVRLGHVIRSSELARRG